MKIDEKSIPDAVVEAACDLVDDIDAKFILKPSPLTDTILRGLRDIPKNAPVARKRIKSVLQSDQPIDPYVAYLLRCTGLSGECLVALSEAALQAEFEDMAAYYGEANFLLAILLDERESVRELAHVYIEDWDERFANSTQREAAKNTIQADFQPLFSRLKEFLDDTLPPATNRVKERKDSVDDGYKKALDKAKADLSRSRKKLTKQQATLQKKINQKHEEVDKLKSDLASEREKLKDQETAIADVNAKLAELQSSFERRLEENLNEALSNDLRRWLKPVVDVEAAVVGLKQSDLPDRVASVLAKQRQRDLHFGNRSELTQMIEERHQLLIKVEQAQVEALNPLPELNELAKQLKREILDFEERLEQSAEDGGATERGLRIRINEVKSHEELANIRKFIQQIDAYDLLHRVSLNRLYQILDDKWNFLYDQCELLGEPQPSPKTGFSIRRAIEKGESFTLFIDGHNVLHRLEKVFGPYFEDGKPGPIARREFGDRLERIFHKPEGDVLLYFDSDEPTQHTLSEQVRVMYSGGTGEHRADRAILNHLVKFGPAGTSTPVCLVTDDNDFAHQANEMGAIIIRSEEFSVSVNLDSA